MKRTNYSYSDHPVHVYAQDVAQGKITVCKWERLACERHLKDMDRAGTEGFPFVFDESRADRIYKWFELCCTHVRGPYSGQPIMLLPWQKFDLGCKYGWVDASNGRRRFRKAYNKRARGNVKSTEMSGLATYGMCADVLYPPGRPGEAHGEYSPEVECAAVDRGQAQRVWRDAWMMADNSPRIKKHLRLKRTFVEHRNRGGHMRALSRETSNKDGAAPCLVIIDEYHAHPTSEIHDVMWSSFGKRAQPIMEIITTAGNDAENNPCRTEEKYARRVLLREVTDEGYFAMMRELDEGDDPHDMDAWVKANPILQDQEDDYAQLLCAQIKTEHDAAYGSGDPYKIREFLTKRCDLWQSHAENKYMSGIMDRWHALAVSREEFGELTQGIPSYRGLDLSKAIDLTADADVFKLPDRRFAVTAHGYIPEAAATRHEHSDRVPYRAWAADDWCTITPGEVTDYAYIEKRMHDKEIEDGLTVAEICYDPYGAMYFALTLASQGYTPVEIRQGVATLSEPTKRFREMVLQGRIVHDGSPLLSWCLSNAVEVIDNNGNIKLSKKHKDDSQRIDLIAAVINAFTRALAGDDDASGYINSEDWGV